MQKKPLKDLLQELEQELLRLGYTEGSMKFYRNRWEKIIQFAKERDEIFYSEQLGINYVEHHYQILEKDFDKTLSQKDTQELRIIRRVFQSNRRSLCKAIGALHGLSCFSRNP